MHRSILSLLSIFSLTAAADPLLSPQEALKKFTAPEGFSVDLIAAEPDITQPIAFCWDARGRIWVVEAKTYPTRRNNKPPGGDSSKPTEEQLKDIFGGEDRILIFGDEDGDGKFETRKVFAEKLNLVSGIELGFGGVYVGAAPYLMHIPDKDGDDQPDGPPEILLDGWGWQDTHETLNSFIWGPDGWLYGCHGVFTHSNVGAPGTPNSGSGVPPAVPQNKDSGLEARATARVPINCHYWRYHPVRRTFEAYASGTSNSWGFDYNEYGDWFSEACVIPHFWHIIQGGYYLRQSNPLGHFNPYVYTNIETIADHLHYIGNTPHSGNNVSDAAGGGHAHCGLCIYNGDNFPPEYRGRAMMFNIHGQRINQEQLVPEGSGYVAKHLPDFVKANDKNFTGVALKVGPDGAVYFIDWYDREKCHRPQPEVWDRSNGRIYRVKYDRTWKPWKGDVGKMEVAAQGAAAIEENGWMQRMARKAFFEASAALDISADEFQKWFGTVPRKLKNPRAQGPHFVIRVMSLLAVSSDGFRRIDPMKDTLLRETEGLTKDIDRAFAVSLLGARQPVASAAELGRFVIDPSPRVRLALASALQRLPLEDRWPIAEALIAHGEDAKDHNLPQMYWYAIEPLVPANPERALALAAKSQIPLVAQHIARRLAESDGGVPHLITALGKEKTAAGTIYLLKAALQGLKGRSGEPAPKGWDGAWSNIDDILARRPDAKPLAGEITDLREALAVSFGDKRAFPKLRDQVRDIKLPVERRQLALQTLLDGKDPEIPSLIMALLDDPAMRLAALNALPRATGK
jgi:putative membrane-bound dehydrogenase-like protein